MMFKNLSYNFIYTISIFTVTFFMPVSLALSLTASQQKDLESRGFVLASKDYVLKFCEGYIEIEETKLTDEIVKDLGFNNHEEFDNLARRTESYSDLYASLGKIKNPDSEFCESISGNLAKEEHSKSAKLEWESLDYQLFLIEFSGYDAALMFCSNLYVKEGSYRKMAETYSIDINNIAELNIIMNYARKTNEYISQVKKYERLVNKYDSESFCQTIEEEMPFYSRR